MNSLQLDIHLINLALHERDFAYPGDYGPGKSNQPLVQFHHISEWCDYLLTLQIKGPKVPKIHIDAYHAALRVMFLAWVEPACIKTAELQALRSLEGALRGVYFQPIYQKKLTKNPKLKREDFSKKLGLGQLLDHMVEHDDLSTSLHSQSNRDYGNALSTIRNRLAHGDPFDTMPWGGLLESVREVMIHAYRNFPGPANYLLQTCDELGKCSRETGS